MNKFRLMKSRENDRCRYTLVPTCLFFSTMPSFYSLKDDIDQLAATMNNSRRLTIKLYRSIRPVRLLNRVVTNKMVSLR